MFGIDDDIYYMCRDLCNFLNQRTYSDLVEEIGIIPIVAPKNLVDDGQWKESKKFFNRNHNVIISKHIDYNQYVSSSIPEKKILIIKNVMDSLKNVAIKGHIDYNKMRDDIEEFCKNNNIILC